MSKESKSIGIVMLMAALVIGLVYNMSIVSSESGDTGGRSKFYTERVFEEYNKDMGLEESEDYEYVYIDGDTRGIVYYEGDLRFSIFPESFMEGEEAIKEYEEVDKEVKQARRLRDESSKEEVKG